MSMKRTLGLLMILAPFALLFIWGAIEVGWLVATIGFICIATLLLWIKTGVELLS